uniref:Leucine rich repeat protein n=1 Tax=Meloidogyne floridensis TaxID=298350 RepID=A0A915NUK3_9BILA
MFCFLIFYYLFLNIKYITTQELNNDYPICQVCRCYEELKIVDCFKGNNKEEFILNMVRLPEWTETFEAFNLSQSEFPHFSMHSGLKKLQIKHSNLQFIHPLAFQPLPGIEELILSDNLIEKLPKNILQTMRNLKVLDLSGNKINGLEGIGGQLGSKGQILDSLVISRNPFCSFNTSEVVKSPNILLPSLPLSRQIHIIEMQSEFIEINENEWKFKIVRELNNKS